MLRMTLTGGNITLVSTCGSKMKVPAIKRRDLLTALAVAPIAGTASAAFGAGAAGDSYWDQIAALYDRPDGITQLEHGNWGTMARPVRDAYFRQLDRVNRDTSFYARRTMGRDLQYAHHAVAKLLGVESDEVVLTRNATEALRTLIVGYKRLKPGDAVLYADHDYDAMQHCMEALREMRGVEVIRIALPYPATHQGLIDAYAAALEANPRVRLILLTHLGHRSGLVLPVAEISALAQMRGADVIVDAAHSLGQLDFKLPELGADFIGVNLHKWIGAPLGVGAMVVRNGRHTDIARDPASDPNRDKGISALMHTGTVDFAAVLALPDAIAFQNNIGGAERAARLRALRNRWTSQLSNFSRVELLTPNDSRLHGAITSFRLRNSDAANLHEQFAARLLDEFGVFTVVRSGLSGGTCIRVTPSLANRMADCDRFVDAVRAILAG